MKPRQFQNNPVGATVPDVILRILASPFLVVPLFLLVGCLIVSLALGFIEISWEGSTIRLSQGQRGLQSTESNIAGEWAGTAKDLQDSEKKITAQYTYNISMTFKQHGRNVEMNGAYTIDRHADYPRRIISAEGVLHDTYLTMLYDIKVYGTPAAGGDSESAAGTTHGTMIFHFLPTSSTATGYYIARGMQTDKFVFGSIDLTRR